MKPIQMVDLKTQHDKLQPELNNKILEVVESTAYIKGEEVSLFEQELAEYLGVKHVIACANGTDALQLAMMALGLKSGDEVITANFTYVATAEIIALLKLKPVLVDVDPKTFNIDIQALKNAITPKTKAIVPVHLFGQCADMEPILELAKKHNLYVVEDTAQSLSAKYFFSNGTAKMAGTIGDIGTTSFFPSKNLGCMGDGGALFTNNDELALKLKMIANHGQSRTYYHDLVGVNSRLDSIQAAVLRIKLRQLNNYSVNRYNAAQYYNELLENVDAIQAPFEAVNSTHVFHQYVLKTKGIDRDKLKSYLLENNVPCNIYYPVPLNKQKAYLDLDSEYPVTESLCKEVIALPIHTELQKEQQDYIVSKIKEFINEN
ncbi:MAG: DegT/DnrJ/EryC1/StrS family aminotransferase [Bacteroidetes bacterium]|nr:DegT/DnrJ/EryC1/StrS family aminotransferase [Bacteroidota bacterium]MCB9226986.1 DegT/DnrJ/EryC1/StrS family aminotransferase [Chitinophagales bacterium]